MYCSVARRLWFSFTLLLCLFFPASAQAHELVAASTGNLIINVIALLVLFLPLFLLYVNLKKATGPEPGWRLIYLAIFLFALWIWQQLLEVCLNYCLARGSTVMLMPELSYIVKVSRPWTAFVGFILLYLGLRCLGRGEVKNDE